MSKVVVRVDSRVRIDRKQISPDVEGLLKTLFTHDNPEWIKKKMIGVATWSEPRRYTNWKIEGDEISFPRGGQRRIVEELEHRGYAVETIDHRSTGKALRWLAKDHSDQTIPDHKFDLWPFQKEAIDKAIDSETCLVRSSTGSGKTTIAFGIAARLKMATIVIVREGALMRQWRKRAPKELGIPERKVGIIREDRAELRPLTVAMQQTLFSIFEKNPELKEKILETFGVLIYDEVQDAAAKTVVQTIDPFRCKYRIGISADETRKDKREFLIYDLFDEAAYEADHDDLVAGGYILDVEVRVVPTAFYTNTPVSDPDFLEEMTTDSRRNALIEKLVIGETNLGQQIVVLTHRREHVIKLDSRFAAIGLHSGTMLGGKNEEGRFANTLEGLASGYVRAAAGTVQVFGKAIDVPSLARGVLATPLSANKQKFNQAKGRFCRRGKDKAILYVMWDSRIFGLKHLRNLASWNKQCLVLDDGKWVPAKQYLKSKRAA